MSSPDETPAAGQDDVEPIARVRAAFDSDFYLAQNADVASAGLEPWGHYESAGWRERRDPAAWFSISDYLAANADVAAAGLEPFGHYVLFGRDEGRHLALRVDDPSARSAASGPALAPVLAEFDSDFYLTVYKDLEPNAENAFAHYLETGWREGRDPTRWFSTRRYLEANEDVTATGVNPFVHYVLTGRGEGRALQLDLGFRYDLIRDAEKFEAFVQSLPRIIPDRPASQTSALTDRLAQLAADAPVHVTVSHDDYTATLGGVQLCLKIESQAMRAAGAAHIHLFPARSGPVLNVEQHEASLGVLVDGVLTGWFDARIAGDALVDACGGRKVTMAVHSLIAHRVADLIAIVERLTIANAYYWLHDFSSLCANYALLRNDAIFCGPPPPQSLACEICTYGARRQVHLAQHVALFEVLDPIVVAPSEAALSVWRRGFPRTARRGVIHTHAAFAPDDRRIRKVQGEDASQARPLRVGFLGMPTTHKGWPVFVQLVKRFAGDARYSFHHLAKETDRSIDVAWKRVAPTAKTPVPMIEAVHALELDVALIWSLWPETFCFAAYEAVAGGAAIITNPDSGNVHDLIRRDGHGLVLQHEGVLDEIFASGEVLKLSRSRREVRRQSLTYSRMTADLILGEPA